MEPRELMLPLTDNDEFDDDPAWSPNRNRIVFTRFDGNDSEIWRMPVDGSDERQLTDNDDFDRDPDWQPEP